ncbi:centrosome cycle [Porites harrisoni]
MYDVDEPITDYQKVVRERASQSLGPVRYALHSPIKSPGSKSTFHRGDNYSSAVTRLKTLLQQYDDAVKTGSPRNPAHSFVNPGIGSIAPGSYIPSTSEVTQLLDNQFAVLQHLEGQVEFYKDALESLKQRTDLVIRENETLFDQLKTQAVTQVLATEKQSKPEEPLDKNEKTSDDQTPRVSKEKDESDTEGDDDDNGCTVHHLGAHGTTADEHWKGRERVQTVGQNDSGEAAKSTRGFDKKKHQTERDPRKSLMPSVLHSSLVDDSFGMSARESQLFMSVNERRFVNQLEEEVDKIRKLHEAKTKHLETLLYSTRDELEDSQRQVLELETKLRAHKVMEEQRNQPVLCVKCGHQAALLSGSHSDAAMETINKLTRERDDLMNTLTGQKAVLAEVRQREFEAYNQVKNSCHMVEQAQLEKAEAIIHVQQLKDDLQKERDRHDQYMKSTSEKMEKERENVRQACLVEANKLSKRLEQSIEARSALENQLERLTREKVDVATELEQAKSQIMTHASEIAQAGDNMQKELEQTRMKFSLASQEITSLKAAAQQAQREKEQERTRLKSEMDTLRRRLQEAEKGWMESKEDCIRFTERLNLAEREAKSAMTAKEKLEKSGAEKVEKLTKQNMEREQQLTALLQETETRHTQCRTELQQMLEAEIKVCNKLKEECKKLTQQLQDSSEKARSRLQEANQECTEMKKKLQECMAQRGDLAAQNAKKDKLIKESDENARKQVDQMCQLLATRNNLMKERKILCQEVEFLRKQLIPKTPSLALTPVDSASNASVEDNGAEEKES